jgi:hypothetical protein
LDHRQGRQCFRSRAGVKVKRESAHKALFFCPTDRIGFFLSALGWGLKKPMFSMGYKPRVYLANENHSQQPIGDDGFYRYISMG